MLTNNKNKPIIGDCEAYCNRTNIEVWVTDRNILMCQDCLSREAELTQKNNSVKSLLVESKKIDDSVETKTDLFNAPTISAIELQAAINADDSIPEDMKAYTYTQVCHERRVHLQKVIFDARQELIRQENEERFWHVQFQTSAAKLQAKYREEFKVLDVNYQPVKPKSIKPSPVGGPSKKNPRLDAREARELAKKYDLDATAIQMIAKAHHLSLEGAAQFMLKQLA